MSTEPEGIAEYAASTLWFACPDLHCSGQGGNQITGVNLWVEEGGGLLRICFAQVDFVPGPVLSLSLLTGSQEGSGRICYAFAPWHF